jgi:CPA2 family monovalent cation:H+ antiporter-2
MQEQRAKRYRLLRELAPAGVLGEATGESHVEQVHPIVLPPSSPAVGRMLAQVKLDGVSVTALVRAGERHLSPPGDTRLLAGDAVVLIGRLEDLQRAERSLLG